MSIFWPFDYNVLNSIQGIRTDFFDYFFSTVTHLATAGIFWIILGVIYCLSVKTRKTGTTMLLALLFNLIVCNLILKIVIARPRPYTVEDFSLITDPSTQLLVGLPSDWSFPSGHTAASFTAATALFCNNKKHGIFAYILALIIAFSRIYLYVHYPTDVIAGIILGCLMGTITYILIKMLCNNEKLKMYIDIYLNYDLKGLFKRNRKAV